MMRKLEKVQSAELKKFIKKKYPDGPIRKNSAHILKPLVKYSVKS